MNNSKIDELNTSITNVLSSYEIDRTLTPAQVANFVYITYSTDITSLLAYTPAEFNQWVIDTARLYRPPTKTAEQHIAELTDSIWSAKMEALLISTDYHVDESTITREQCAEYGKIYTSLKRIEKRIKKLAKTS